MNSRIALRSLRLPLVPSFFGAALPHRALCDTDMPVSVLIYRPPSLVERGSSINHPMG